MQKIIRKIDAGIFAVENVAIILLLGVMVFMAFLQVVLRNFFDTGILWGDIFLRHLVLWVGFIGASIATREEKHINIDILTRVVKPAWIPYIRVGVYLVTLIICAVLTKAGYVFLSYEKEAGTILFKNIPAWYFQLIIPVGFALIGFRFFLKIVELLTSSRARQTVSSTENETS